LNREKILLKITEKWPVKIISIAAALVISVFYKMNTIETRYITVPLVVEPNKTFVSVSAFANSVRVSLRGETSINSIDEEDIEAFIDLKKYNEEGTFWVPIQIRRNGTALAVDPLEITVFPMETQIMLEQKDIRNIPVFPVFEGTIAQGFEMTRQSIVPSYVSAEGPSSSLGNQYEFLTEPIDIDRRYEDFSVLVNIVNNDPLIKIHGDRTVEYSASISVIRREYNYPVNELTQDNLENGDELE
jgi:YbbR domain-containing protein